MQKEVLIVKNITREGPGLLEEILREQGIFYRIVDMDKGDNFPPMGGFGAVVVLGGPDSANDESIKMKEEILRIRETIAAGIPFLGICLGLQAMVKAAGGRVTKCPAPEIGFHDADGLLNSVELTQEGIADPMFTAMEKSFHVFHLHGETVELAEDMVLLASGKFCRNQVVRVGKTAYGLQCHFELTSEMLETWLREDPDLAAMEPQKLREDFHQIREEYTSVGRNLFQQFLHIAGFP